MSKIPFITLILSFWFVSFASAGPSTEDRGLGDQTIFAGVSGYAAGKKCHGGKEGKDESASGVRPSLHTVENPGGGWAMAAVSPSMFGRLRGCEGKVNGVKVKVMDTCPACKKNGKIDINHNSCSKMDSSNAGLTVVTWTNCPANSKGLHPKVKTKN